MRTIGMITQEVDGRPFVDYDDEPLIEALAGLGVELRPVAWTDEASWRGCPALVARSCWDYVDRFDHFESWLHRVREQGPSLRNHPTLILWNRHKAYLRDLGQRGAPLPTAIWADGPEVPLLADVVREQRWETFVIKPLVGVSSRGVLRVSAKDAAAHQEEFAALARQSGAVLLPYLRAVEHIGERSLLYADGNFVHAVRKVPPPGDFRVSGERPVKVEKLDHVPGSLLDAGARVLKAAKQHAVEALGLSEDEARLLYARVDLLPLTDEEEGPVVLNELEIIEPTLYLRTGGNAAAQAFARAIAEHVRR